MYLCIEWLPQASRVVEEIDKDGSHSIGSSHIHKNSEDITVRLCTSKDPHRINNHIGQLFNFTLYWTLNSSLSLAWHLQM